MDRLAQEPGIIGFRLSSIGGPRDPFAPMQVEEFATYRIWKHAAEQDYVIWLYPRAIDAHLVPYLLQAFPQVRVVLNHLGVCPGAGKSYRDEKGRPRISTPAYNPALHTTYRLNRYENVVVKLSGQPAFSSEEYPYRDLTRWHRNLFDAYGPGRLMWGTDFPWNLADPGYEKLIGVVRELLPDLVGERPRRHHGRHRPPLPALPVVADSPQRRHRVRVFVDSGVTRYSCAPWTRDSGCEGRLPRNRRVSKMNCY